MSRELEKGLVSMLSGQTIAADRIHPHLQEQVKFPAIKYRRIYTIRQQSLDGNVGVTEAGLQLELMANKYSQVKALADEVRTILHGYSGTWGTLIARNVNLFGEDEKHEQDGDRVTEWVIHSYAVWTNMD